MEVGAVAWREAAASGQPQMRLEYQRPQDMTQPGIREIPCSECQQHPIIGAVESRIEEVIVRLEGRPLQPAFRLQLPLAGAPRVRQRPPEIRNTRAVAH